MTNVESLHQHIEAEMCDFVVNIGASEQTESGSEDEEEAEVPDKVDITAGLRCLIPLQMICMATAKANGIDIDGQIQQAI